MRPRPQSNQRGIETLDDLIGDGLGMLPQSNQRGIETQSGGDVDSGDVEPQSNQRGIETASVFACAMDGGEASIEPAWD